jgi:hypothetical protein
MMVYAITSPFCKPENKFYFFLDFFAVFFAVPQGPFDLQAISILLSGLFDFKIS